ncbi:MAG: glycerophosphodiester phosphodiesterase family protein [Solirubrobacterales bacterium]
MLNRISLATIFAVLLGLFATAGASAADPDRPATPPPTDFWQNKGFMNMAHQGGELEAPGNTLFAFKTAIADRGADTLEMDGYLTEDGVFVITHDLSSNATSNLSLTSFAGQTVDQLTLEELKTLDFAHKFTPGKGHYSYTGTDDYPYRGMALEGGPTPPAGYTRNDFRIATFREVLDAFPDTPINVDMKAPGNNPGLANLAAIELADVMADYPERSEDVIVASFAQGAMETFHAENPDHKALSGSEQATLSYVQGNPLVPTPVAVQPPDLYNFGGTNVRTVPLLKPFADYDGFAMHVWGSDKDPDQEETDAFYQTLIDEGADGFFTQKPAVLHEFLCRTGVARPDGSPRCATQICPEGQEGIAPDNCTLIPPTTCPEGQTGTPPDCTAVVVPPAAKSKIKKLKFNKVKKKTKSGKKLKLTLKITASEGTATKAKIKLKSSSRKVKLPRSITVKLKPGSTVRKKIVVKSNRKAKGKVRIKANSAASAAKATVNPVYKPSGKGKQSALYS